jgi:hypothetical protein
MKQVKANITLSIEQLDGIQEQLMFINNLLEQRQDLIDEGKENLDPLEIFQHEYKLRKFSSDTRILLEDTTDLISRTLGEMPVKLDTGRITDSIFELIADIVRPKGVSK